MLSGKLKNISTADILTYCIATFCYGSI